jgi:hypothetical protein
LYLDARVASRYYVTSELVMGNHDDESMMMRLVAWRKAYMQLKGWLVCSFLEGVVASIEQNCSENLSNVSNPG